jgi:hypothetical protein
VIGPVTPGDCVKFFSTTAIADAMTTCNTGGSGTPGGTNGSIQYNSAGAFGGFVASGDATINTTTGAVLVTKSNGVAFGTAAFANTGTSGGTIGLLNGANSWSATQTFTSVTLSSITGSTQCLQVNTSGVVSGFGGACAPSTFTAAGTGAVSRSVTSKLGDFLSVTDFGAVDDNSTDNTAKIQAAINQAQSLGRTLYFPITNNGVYLLNTAFNSSRVLNITAPLKMFCEPGVWLKPSGAITTAQSILYFTGTSAATELVQGKVIIDGCNIGDPAATVRTGNHAIVFDTTNSTTSLFVQPTVQNIKVTYSNINSHACFSSTAGCAIMVLNNSANTTGGTYGALFANSMLAGGVNFTLAGDSNALRDVFFPPDLTDANASNEGVYANLITGAGVLLLDNVNCQVLNGCLIVDNAASVEVKNPNFEQIGTNVENNNSMIDLGSSVIATTVGVGPVHIIGGNIASSDCTNHPFLITYNKVAGGFFDGLRLGANCATYPHAMMQVTSNAVGVGIGAGNTWFLNGAITTTTAQQYSAVAANAYKITTGTP